jgi:hypothetical protein
LARPDSTSLTAFSRSSRRFRSSGLTRSSLAAADSFLNEGTDAESAGGAATAAGLSETLTPDARLRPSNPTTTLRTDEPPGSVMPAPAGQAGRPGSNVDLFRPV